MLCLLVMVRGYVIRQGNVIAFQAGQVIVVRRAVQGFTLLSVFLFALKYPLAANACFVLTVLRARAQALAIRLQI